MPGPEGYRYQPSPKAQEAKRQAVFQKLEVAVGEITDSETFRTFLDVQSRFHHYSYKNTLLILAQRPAATRVAGLHTWNTLGRFVNKGERGIDILAPVFPKGTAKEQDEQQIPVSYVVVKTFDTSARRTASRCPSLMSLCWKGMKAGYWMLPWSRSQLATGYG